MQFTRHFSLRLMSFCMLPAMLAMSLPGRNQKLDLPVQVKSLNISYVGNMGVLVNSQNGSILIDGIHEFYGPEYLNTPAQELNKILQRQSPYDKLTTLLFTHYHKDHYSSNLANSFLKLSQQNRVAGSPQVIDSLAADQTVDGWNKNGMLFKDAMSGLAVYAFNIPHTGQQRHSKVQNIAYLVKSDKLNILHIGDADIDPAAFERIKLGKVDILIAPIWFLTNQKGIQLIQEIIRPGKVIATHISPQEKQSLEKYKLAGTETYFFTRIGEIITLHG